MTIYPVCDYILNTETMLKLSSVLHLRAHFLL